jgi:hypothetical protein
MVCKGTLRQVFIRVYRLEILALYSVAPLPFYLIQLSPLPPPCMNKYIYCMHLYSVKGGGYGVLSLTQINTCRKVPLQVNYFR